MFGSIHLFAVASSTIPLEPFIFVRHGETDWSRDAIDQGPQDLPLNEQGKAEAASVADRLSSVIDDDSPSYVMMTSSLQRTIDTAKIIADKTHIPIYVEQDLQERYYGDFSLKAMDPPADAESEAIFQQRILNAIRKVFSDAKTRNNKKILVSHGEVFKYLSKLLTSQEETIPRGGMVMFVPSKDPDAHQPWSIVPLHTTKK